jgi:TolB protein
MRRRRVSGSARRLVLVAACLSLAGCGGASERENIDLIAFARAPATNAFSDIFLLQLDGSLRRLTHGGIDSEPAWSPDGQRIAFLRAERNAAHRLFVARADGSGQRSLPERVTDHATWGPDGDRLLFALAGRVLIARPETRAPRVLVDELPSIAGDARWSPDGSRVVFVLGQSETSGDVYVVSVRGERLDRLTRLGPRVGRPYSPLYSPDGTRIAYLLAGSLVVMNADGSAQTVLARFAERDFPSSLAWSPDGRTIAYARLRLGGDRRGSGIYIVDADDGELRRLTREIDSNPEWSPDGERIVFQRLVGFHVSEIAIMNRDGTNQTTLTEGGWSDVSPVWQPSDD